MTIIKPSDVLRDAAGLLLKEGTQYSGCCGAIKNVFGGSQVRAGKQTRERAHQLFSSLYKPKNSPKWAYWFHKGDYMEHTPESQQHRVTALLLTADMAESVGE